MATIEEMYKPILPTAPSAYVHYQQWPEYAAEKNYPKLFGPRIVMTPERGFRRGLWPFFVEEYIGDTEPTLTHNDPEAPARFILWRRVSRSDIPAGWHQSTTRPSSIESFIELPAEGNYAASWAKIARNERARWLELKDTTYAIDTLSWEQYLDVFKRSTIKKLGLTYIDTFKQKLHEDPAHYRLYGVRDMRSNTFVAAMGVIYSPTYQSSFYDVGCKVASVDDPVMVGLIDHWFETSRAEGIRYLQLGGSWIPGKPTSWKGFSFFKAKFKPNYILFPPLLWKFKKGRLF